MNSLINYLIFGHIVYIILMFVRYKEIKKEYINKTLSIKMLIVGYILTVLSWPIAIILNILYRFGSK